MEKENKNNPLTFPETIVLLALNDKGWFGNSENRIRFGLAGAVLFKLEEERYIGITGNQVLITGTKETGDKVLDTAMEVLRKSKKNMTLKSSVQRLVYKSGVKWKPIVKDLVKRNILKKEEYQLLRIFYQDKYPLENTEIKKQILRDLYEKIIGEKELSPEDLMLLAVMRTCKMIDKNFLLHEHFLKVRTKIREITEFREPLNESTAKVSALQDAIRLAILTSNVSLHV